MLEKAGIAAGWLGSFLSIVGLALLGMNPTWRLWATLIESAALVLLVFFFIVHFETMKSFSMRRSTQLGTNSILMAVLFIGILGIVNFISAHHSHRVDLSETQRFTLAPQTVRVLSELKRDVQVMAFTRSQTREEAQIKDLLENYRHHSGRISYEMIDPDKKPAVARQHGITQYDTLVLVSDSRENQIKNATEQELTNAIIRVTKDQRRSVYFLQDHGEHRIDDTERNGYSRAREALERQGYQVAGLSLLQTGEVPSDTTALILAGPQKPLLPREKEALTAYLNSGGRVLALLDPLIENDLDDFLKEWGIRLGHGAVLDPELFIDDPTKPAVLAYPPHEITHDFRLPTVYPLAQAIRFDSSREDLEFNPLVQTTPESWSKGNPKASDLRFDPKEDLRGPLTLAGIVTRKTGQASEEASGPTAAPAAETAWVESTLAVLGDSDFANNNSFYFSGNGDLFLNVVNYLAKEKDLIAITPKQTRFAPLFLSAKQSRVLTYVSLILAPAAVFLAGLGVFRHRRRL